MAWKFRQEFQSRLGLVFDHLSTIYHSFPGRITAETFKNQITAIVDIWDDWIVFPPDFTGELRQRLEGMTVPSTEKREAAPAVEQKEAAPTFKSKFKSSSFRPAEEISADAPPTFSPAAPATVTPDDDDGEPMDVESDVDGSPVDDVDGEPVDGDVDGAPIAEDVDGEPIGDDVDGEPIADDIDGVPIADDVDGVPIADDIDGEPMQDDIDGEPMEVAGVDEEPFDASARQDSQPMPAAPVNEESDSEPMVIGDSDDE